MSTNTLVNRLQYCQNRLEELLNAQAFPFDTHIRGVLPTEPGIYRIFLEGAGRETSLRVGQTRTAQNGLRQRVYQNHLMGTQDGNLRAQLVGASLVSDLQEAKEFIRKGCLVQWIVESDDRTRAYLEHFALAILQPLFTDYRLLS